MSFHCIMSLLIVSDAMEPSKQQVALLYVEPSTGVSDICVKNIFNYTWSKTLIPTADWHCKCLHYLLLWFKTQAQVT